MGVSCLVAATDLTRNPLLEDAGAFEVSRRDECAYNQLRLGCASFAHGFRGWNRDAPVHCTRCGGNDSATHYLLTCPALAEQRKSLVEGARAELQEKNSRDADRAEALAKEPPMPRHWRGPGHSVIGKYPASTLWFVANSQAWLDQIVLENDCLATDRVTISNRPFAAASDTGRPGLGLLSGVAVHYHHHHPSFNNHHAYQSPPFERCVICSWLAASKQITNNKFMNANSNNLCFGISSQLNVSFREVEPVFVAIYVGIGVFIFFFCSRIKR